MQSTTMSSSASATRRQAAAVDKSIYGLGTTPSATRPDVPESLALVLRHGDPGGVQSPQAIQPPDVFTLGTREMVVPGQSAVRTATPSPLLLASHGRS